MSLRDDNRREQMVLGIARKWHNIRRHLRSDGDDILQAGRLAYVESGGDPAAVNRAMTREVYRFHPRSRSDRHGEVLHPQVAALELGDGWRHRRDPTDFWTTRLVIREAPLTREERLCLVGREAGYTDRELALALGYRTQGVRSRGVCAARKRAREKVIACAT